MTNDQKSWFSLRTVTCMAVVVFLCLLVGFIYRPLNSTERQLLGTWESKADGYSLEFRADRKCYRHGQGAYRWNWRASREHLFVLPPVSPLQMLQFRAPSSGDNVHFQIEGDRLILHHGATELTRVLSSDF